MSTTREITIWCDAEVCGEWTQLNNYESHGGQVNAARVAARRGGWTHVGGKDFCRTHSTFKAKIVPDPLYDGPSISLQELRAQHP